MKNKTSILVGTRLFFYALLVAVIFCGCGTDGKTPEQREVKETKAYKSEIINFSNYQNNVKVNTVVIDSCEYLYAWFGMGNGGGSFTHKGNCKFCAERSKK
jgi:hypothetical protein